MQVDWGGKLRVNHIMNVCPLRLIGELMKPIKMDTASVGEVMIQVFTLWIDACSLKLIGEPMIQSSSFTLCTLIMMQSQRISLPKDCGEDYHKLDKLKMHFPTPNQSRDIEVHNLFLTWNTMKVATIYLLNGILGRNICNLHYSGRKAQVSSLPKQRGVTELLQQNLSTPNSPRRDP